MLGAEIVQSFGLNAEIVQIINRYIGAGILRDVAERLRCPAGMYLEMIEETIVAHAGDRVDDVRHISIAERLGQRGARGFDDDAITG